jgi:hypothetical protein
MPARPVTTAAILLLTAAVIASSFLYGPARRKFLPETLLAPVASTADLDALYQTAGVRGRVLIFFSRDLIVPEELPLFPETRYIHHAMNRGIIRKIIHIVPDRSWPEVSQYLLSASNYWKADRGLAGRFENGRVDVMPLSEVREVREKALIVVDVAAWTRQELTGIAGLIRAGNIRSDLLAVIRGSSSDLELFQPGTQAAGKGPKALRS